MPQADVESGESILQALARLWEAIKSKFRRVPEYRQVYLHAEIDDSEHLQKLAEGFANRGRRLRHTAYITLFVSLTFVALGILVFLMPTRFTDVDKARAEVESAQEDARGIRIEMAKSQVEYQRARDLYNLYGLFYEAHRTFQTLSTVFADRHRDLLNDCLVVSKQLVAPQPEDTRLEYDLEFHFDQNGPVNLPAEAFVAAREELRESSITWSTIHEALTKLSELDQGEAANQEVASAANEVARKLQPIVAVYQSAKTRFKNQGLALTEEEKNKIETVEQLEAIDRRVSDALLEASQPQSGWDPSQPWATVLTIRVGIVILLLYLTTILLATFRYMLTLSAYYTARADAIQMLSSQPIDKLYDVEELQKLIPLLSPDQYRIDKDPVPYESVVKGLRPTGP